jgi:hypothetical protein
VVTQVHRQVGGEGVGPAEVPGIVGAIVTKCAGNGHLIGQRIGGVDFEIVFEIVICVEIGRCTDRALAEGVANAQFDFLEIQVVFLRIEIGQVETT